MFKKLIASAVISLGLAVSGTASAVIVNGVDFGNRTTHLETTTLAETFVNGVGQTLTGYGQINTVNGNLSYAGANRLYFVLSYNVTEFNVNAFGVGNVAFDSGLVTLYLRSTFNTLDQSSADNIALIQAGSVWATLGGHASFPSGRELTANGALTGASLSFNGQGLLDVTSGANGVFEFLNANDIFDGLRGFADIAVTTSGANLPAGLNTFDNTTGCNNGTARPGQFCFSGSADLRGNTIPEPGVLGLVGLGLLGMGAALRKRKSA